MNLIFDLNSKKRYRYNDFIKKFGNKTFDIIYKNSKLTVQLYKKEQIIDSYYILSSLNGALDIHFEDKLHIPAKKIPHTLYLANITKTGDYSGSLLVNIAVAVGKHIQGVKIMHLIDAATIYCEDGGHFDLTLYKLLMKKETFYNRFGFYLYNKYLKIQQKYMMKIITKFDKYLISNILKSIQELMDYCKKHYYDKIYVKQIYYNIIEQRRIQYYDLKEILRHFLSLYFLLLPYKKLTFKETIEKIHERGCVYLEELFNSLENCNIFEIFAFSKKNEKRMKKDTKKNTKNKVVLLWVKEYGTLLHYRKAYDGSYIRKI